MFENPPSDPHWLVVLTQILHDPGTFMQVPPAEPLWRDGWTYTPYEAMEAIDGWIRHPAIGGLHLGNWQSLVDDVTNGLRPMVDVISNLEASAVPAPLLHKLSQLRGPGLSKQVAFKVSARR
jgi:hypothetical protein